MSLREVRRTQPVDRSSLFGLRSRAVALAVPARYAFHAELSAVAIERMRRFSGLLLLVHVPLLARDLTLDAARASAVESRWQWWLLVLHVSIAVASIASLVALAMQSAVKRVSDSRGRPLSLRVGVTRGDIVAGVLGRERLLYDIWGDAVNLASRLETSAEPGETLVSDAVTPLLWQSHELGPKSERELKGKGRVAVRSLLGRRVAPAGQ